MKIYLSGGFHSGWQDRVMNEAPQHEYFNPLTDADQRFAYRWTTKDIDGMKWCEIVFAYFEQSNPSGLGLAKEIGWATILDKPIVFIDEHERINLLLAACSQRLYSKLEPAIEYLRTLK